MAAGILLGSAIIVAPFMFDFGQWSTPGSMGAGDWALMGSIVATCFVVVLFLEIIRLAGPTFFAQFNYLAVAAGIGWGALIFWRTSGCRRLVGVGLDGRRHNPDGVERALACKGKQWSI